MKPHFWCPSCKVFPNMVTEFESYHVAYLEWDEFSEEYNTVKTKGGDFTTTCGLCDNEVEDKRESV